VGALYVNRQLTLMPQLHGGAQEHGLRAGTLPTHQIVGMGAALAYAQNEMAAQQAQVSQLAKIFQEALQALPQVTLNGTQQQHLANIMNFTIVGVNNEALLYNCPELAFSTGSACSSLDPKPSHVLKAMGLSVTQINSSVRISLGRDTTLMDIEHALELLSKQIKQLRNTSPLWKN
jgi:cysteine desulfurase